MKALRMWCMYYSADLRIGITLSGYQEMTRVDYRNNHDRKAVINALECWFTLETRWRRFGESPLNVAAKTRLVVISVSFDGGMS